jgi:hypothetical protein
MKTNIKISILNTVLGIYGVLITVNPFYFHFTRYSYYPS